MLRLISLFGLLLLMSHWSACAYFILNLRHSPTWAADLLAQDNADLSSETSIYVVSLYYSFLSILGNDVLSNSRLFSISMLMVGAVLVATIFGNMTVLLANSDAQTRAHYEKLERVKQSLVRMEVTPKLQSRVIKYYEYMWRRQKSGTDGQQGNFVTELPMALKAEVQLHLHEQLVLKVPFFKGCDRLFLQDIVAALVGRIYGPGDNIIVEGDTGKEMFFLEAGLVQVIKAQADGSNKVIVELGKGNFFGEMSLLEARGKTSAGILATTFCDVQVLPKTSFEQIMDDWPEYLPRFMAVALKRKEDTIKREKAMPDEDDAASSMEVGFDVRRRKQQGAWKNAGKAIMASNNLQKIKALNLKTAAAANGGGGGLSRGRTLSGNMVSNDADMLDRVAALSLSSPSSAAPPPASAALSSMESNPAANAAGTGGGALGLKLNRPRSAAQMKEAMGLNRTSSGRMLDDNSPSAALRRATSNEAGGGSGGSGLGSALLAEDVKDRLGAVEDAVDGMGTQLTQLQSALASQTALLNAVLEQVQRGQQRGQQQPDSPGSADLSASGGDSEMLLTMSSAEIEKSISARSPPARSAAQPPPARGQGRRKPPPSPAAAGSGSDSSGAPPAAPPSAPPDRGGRRKSLPDVSEDGGGLKLGGDDDDDMSAMDVEALLAAATTDGP